MNEVNDALSMIKEVYDDQEAEINGNVYTFTKTKHRQRLKVFSFYMKVAKQLESNDMSFLGSEEFEYIEKIISDIILFDGSQLSKLKDHWENDEFTGDYIILITTAMAVISYPFLKGSVGN
jgi:hypothetical protein